jgi:hypothetical protein
MGLSPQLLDPFGYFPGARSGIDGLGGEQPLPQPGYAFHTIYVHPGARHVSARIAIEGLTAKGGTLHLQMLDLNADGSGIATIVAARRLPLGDVALTGELVLRTRAKADKVYAVAGSLITAEDARADRIEIRLDAVRDGRAYERRVARGRGAIFGPTWRERLFGSPVSMIVGPATIATPVSQMCTADQFDEPGYAHWRDRLALPTTYHRKQWEQVYIMRVLDVMAMLGPGMKGLGFGVGAEPLASAMAQMGCEILATDLPDDDERSQEWRATGQHAAAAARLHFPAVCDGATFARNVRFCPVDMNHIPADLAGFDFCWSSCAYEHLGSIDRGLAFVENSLRPLRPGGIAVHTSELNLSSNRATMDHNSTVLFRRRDMEKLARRLLDKGHWVAPFNYDQGDRDIDRHIDMPPFAPEHLKLVLGRFASTSFGIIIRKKA